MQLLTPNKSQLWMNPYSRKVYVINAAWPLLPLFSFLWGLPAKLSKLARSGRPPPVHNRKVTCHFTRNLLLMANFVSEKYVALQKRFYCICVSLKYFFFLFYLVWFTVGLLFLTDFLENLVRSSILFSNIFGCKKIVNLKYLRLRLCLSLSVIGRMVIWQLFVTELPFISFGKSWLDGQMHCLSPNCHLAIQPNGS